MRAQVKGFLTGLVMALTLGTAVTVIAQSWTAPRTWTDGETVTAALLNTHIRDNATVLRAGGIAIASQAANEIIYATSATQLGRTSDFTYSNGQLGLTTSSTSKQLALLSSSGTDSNVWLALDNDAHTWNVGIDGSASDDFYVYNVANGTKRLSITPAGVMTIAGSVNSASAQPGFLAYNSVTDNSVASGSTVEFDTEVYDEAGNFANNTFTAPVTGRYHLCVTLAGTGTSAGLAMNANLVTSNRTYTFRGNTTAAGASSSGASGCVYADMDASDTASVQVFHSTTLNVAGGASPLLTFFSGRLVP